MESYPPRTGNAHPNIVPYGAFEAQDGFVIIAIGTDGQFEKFCRFVEREDLLSHPHYLDNKGRVHYRHELIPEMNKIIRQKPKAYWIENLEAACVPTGSVNTLVEAFQDPQVKWRKIAQSFEDGLKTVASPLHLSESVPCYTKRPPRLGEHTEEILSTFLSSHQIQELKDKGIT